MFAVAKIKSFQNALGYKSELENGSSNTSKRKLAISRKLANGNAVCKLRKVKTPVEGVKPCFNRTANMNEDICIRFRSCDELCPDLLIELRETLQKWKQK